MPGHPGYESNTNFPKILETLRKYKRECKEDFLGRSKYKFLIKGSTNFYYMDYPRKVDFERIGPIEAYYKSYYLKNTKAGVIA